MSRAETRCAHIIRGFFTQFWRSCPCVRLSGAELGVHEIHGLGRPKPAERMRAPAERRRAAQAAMGMLMQAAAAIVAESGAMSAQQEAAVRRLIDEASPGNRRVLLEVACALRGQCAAALRAHAGRARSSLHGEPSVLPVVPPAAVCTLTLARLVSSCAARLQRRQRRRRELAAATPRRCRA